MPHITQSVSLLGASFLLIAGSVQSAAFQSLPDNILEPAGIYNSAPVNVLRVDAQSLLGTGPCVAGDYRGCTLNDILNDADPEDNFKPEIKIHFTAGDFPDDGLPSNATLRARAVSRSQGRTKSFRIKFDSKNNLWRGQRYLQVNKHASDVLRVRNKLSFDLMKSIPHLPSLRTQFVNLFVDGEDQGLFTHIERVDKRYLQRRNWNVGSSLYKAENFDFRMHDRLSLNAQGKPLNKKGFKRILEIKRGKDHRALLNMISDVNNAGNNFKTDVLDKHFNLNNFLAWEAAIILMGNTDVTTYNYYLYNPKGTEKFYFLPWDFDSSWGYDWDPATIAGDYVPGKSYQGPHNLWATAFGRRFLSQPGALDQLNAVVREIKDNYLSPGAIKRYADSYYNLVVPFISRSPDIDHMPTIESSGAGILAEYNQVYKGLASAVQKNYERFLKEQNSPMPFEIDPVRIESNDVVFSWEASFDLQGDTLTYDLQISDSPKFEPSRIKFEAKGLTTTGYSVPWMLPRGDYFFRIIARDSANPQENWQPGLEKYDDNIALPLNVNFDGTSTPPQTAQIIIDGRFSDWAEHTAFSDSTGDGTLVNWDKVWTDEGNGSLSFSYTNVGNIDASQLHLRNIYLDTDKQNSTGYGFSLLGADYLLQGKNLYQYTGRGQNWSWKYLTEVSYAINGARAEFSIEKSTLGLTADAKSYSALFYGTDPSGGSLDYLLIDVNAGSGAVVMEEIAIPGAGG